MTKLEKEEAIIAEAEKLEQQVDASLKALEDGIKMLEKRYLDATTLTGNIVNGWEGYADAKLRNQTNSQHVTKRDKKNRVKEYFFSKSSYSYTLNESKNGYMLEENSKKKRKK